MAREIIDFFLTTAAGLGLLALNLFLSYLIVLFVIETVKVLKAYKDLKVIKKEVQDDGSNESN